MILFLAGCLFAVLWGLNENRTFHEMGEWRFLGHFKWYHLFLAVLIGLVSFLGAEGSIAKFAFLMVWNILGLDVVWWVKRYWDITHGDVAVYLPETHAWHQREDWDNWLGLPLLLRTYWWWHVFAALLVVLGVVIAVG